jgi:predicted ATP-grasp superfamily ATP-dependent carboligase
LFSKVSLDSQAIILAAGPNGLGAIRSLNLEGISLDVIAATPDDVVLSSRLPIRKVALQKNKNEQELLSILLNWPKSNLVLIPTSDWYVNFLSKNQQILTEKFSFVIPNGDLSYQLIDKQKEVELVKNLVTLPKSLLILPDSAEQLLANISLPIIIKPRSNEMNYIGQKNIQIYNDIELDSFYQTFADKLQYLSALTTYPSSFWCD